MSNPLSVEGVPTQGLLGKAKAQINEFLGLDFPYGEVLGDEDLIEMTGDYDAPEVASQLAENSSIITEVEDGYALNRSFPAQRAAILEEAYTQQFWQDEPDQSIDEVVDRLEPEVDRDLHFS